MSRVRNHLAKQNGGYRYFVSFVIKNVFCSRKIKKQYIRQTVFLEECHILQFGRETVFFGFFTWQVKCISGKIIALSRSAGRSLEKRLMKYEMRVVMKWKRPIHMGLVCKEGRHLKTFSIKKSYLLGILITKDLFLLFIKWFEKHFLQCHFHSLPSGKI